MGNRKHRQSGRLVEYYAPSHEAIMSFVQSICDKLVAAEGSNTYAEEIRREFADFVEIVIAISVARANRDADESLDNPAAEE